MVRLSSVSRERVGWVAIYVGMIAWAVFWSFPWVLEKPAIHPTDPAFTPLSHVFFAEGRPWGAHTLHTSGVWGFLRFPMYHPETLTLLTVVHVGLGALIGWFFVDRSRALPRGRWVMLLVSAALLPLISVSGIKLYGSDLQMASDDARWYIPIFGLLIMRAGQRTSAVPSALVWALALGAAMALHTKGNLFVAAAVVVLATLSSDIYQRRVPWTSVLMLGWTVVLLYAGGGDLVRFARYTLHVIESTRAYPEAFSLSNEVLAPLIFLSGVGLATVAVFLQVERRWQWPLALGFALLFFLLYKGAFVRYDAVHMMRSLTVVVLMVSTGLVAAISRWPSTGKSRRREVATVGLAAASLAFFSTPLLDPDIALPVLDELTSHPSAAADFLGASRSERERTLDQRFARIRAEAPLPEIEGTVATIGTYHTVLLAHEKREETIPVIAHYEVWSPRTAEAMDGYLQSEEAPRFLLRSGNYASLSNEVTLARLYRPIFEREFHTVLERRDTALAVRSETVFEGEVEWDEVIEIPEQYRSTVLVADVVFEKNLLGRLVGFLHHPPHANMVLEKPNGTETRVRLNPLLAADGVVVAAKYGQRVWGNWGGAAWALHTARHPILTETESNVRHLKFQARTMCGTELVRLRRRRTKPRCREATALFQPVLRVRIRALSFDGEGGFAE